jgi:hypothetical protein
MICPVIMNVAYMSREHKVNNYTFYLTKDQIFPFPNDKDNYTEFRVSDIWSPITCIHLGLYKLCLENIFSILD